jgi:hypothetical protein
MTDGDESKPKPEPTKPARPRRAARREEPPPPRWVVPAVMITILVVGGWFIIQNLTETSRMEDCQMAGRKNCVAPIDTSNMH